VALVSLEEQVGAILAQRGLTLTTAESCTGGLIAHRITNVSGASDYFLMGFVTYSNGAKKRFLGVPGDTLADHGAVSREVAESMALGARKASDAHVAIAVTGIAGPTGGTAEKPVGTVYMALAADDKTFVRHHRFSGDRAAIKWQTAEEALRLLLEYLGGVPA
jgi:PncC family amidohydrolase